MAILLPFIYALLALPLIRLGMRIFRSKDAIKSDDKKKFIGKTVAITGGTCGIGKEVVKELCLNGATVITCGRFKDKVKFELIPDIIAELQRKEILAPAEEKECIKDCIMDLQNGIWTKEGEFVSKKLLFKPCDLSVMAECKLFATWVSLLSNTPPLDAIVNCAAHANRDYEVTPDGYESIMAVNCLAAIVLTENLLALLKPDGKIINLSSSYPLQTCQEVLVSTKLEDILCPSKQNFSTIRQYFLSKHLLELYGSKLKADFAGNPEYKNIKVCDVRPPFDRAPLQAGKKPVFIEMLRLVFYPLVWAFLTTPYESAQPVLKAIAGVDLASLDYEPEIGKSKGIEIIPIIDKLETRVPLAPGGVHHTMKTGKEPQVPEKAANLSQEILAGNVKIVT